MSDLPPTQSTLRVLGDFKGTHAYAQFIAAVYVSFSALFQGDHLGVEFACCAHAAMLEEPHRAQQAGDWSGH